MRTGARWLGLVVCGAVGCAGDVPAASHQDEDEDDVGARVEALGEPMDGFPNWEERVVHVYTNRARADPAADLAACGSNCGEAACYGPVPPLVWRHDMGRLSRFHSDNLTRTGCFQHDSPCAVQTDISTRYTPGSCDGSASCACSDTPGCGRTDAAVTIIWERFDLFGVTGGSRGENIASVGDPVSTFYAWLHERDTNAMCGYRVANGHRYNILNGSYRSLGVGKATTSNLYTQDFHSSGTPDGLVVGAHTPRTGSPIAFRASWYRASGPTTSQVNVAGTCHPMTLERGTATNGTYLANVSGISGCTRYYFHFTSGAADVFYPTTGSYGIGCATDWDATRPATCGCTPACSGRACGPDGCGGSCGTCAAGETCTASGTCMAMCMPSCGGRVCGADGCGGSCGTCGSGRTCSGSGTCDCSGGRTDCGGSCVDLATNRNHCGACGRVCAASEACVAGACTCTPSCSGRACGGDGCGGSCGTCSAGRVCGAGGTCECGGGLVDCGGACVDTRIDAANCGSCGVACVAGETCAAGTCSAVAPDAGCMPACTGRACGDDTCGGSCGSCASGEVCGAGGVCLCADGATDCAGACVDTRIDSAHCGGCGMACATGEACLGGACVPGAAESDGGVPVPGVDGGVPPGVDGGTAGGEGLDRIIRGGCECGAAPGRRGGSNALALIAVVGLLVVGRRRRRRRWRGQPGDSSAYASTPPASES